MLRKVEIQYNERKEPSNRVIFGIPTTGQVRFEWAASIWDLIKPTNWQMALCSPMGYDVPTARNFIVKHALDSNYEWVFFNDHDVVLPSEMFLTLRHYMLKGDVPILSGLYYTKATHSEPLVYREMGEGPYYDWEHGDKFWVAGAGLGCALIHTSLFRAMKPPWFINPGSSVSYDVLGTPSMRVNSGGTEDLYWYNRVVEENIIEKTGWKIPHREYPIFMDTSIFCQHISLDTGLQYPNCLPKDQWMRDHLASRASHERARERSKKARARA
jgi:hypothetical protein